MRNAGYFRYPTIASDLVAFVSEDDLWVVPAEGGVARRLTANLTEVSRPILSPDGQRIAFTGREEHHPEVYVMAAEGGPAERVTWQGATAIVRGWLPDGRILYVSDLGQPFASEYQAWAVAPDGGPPELLHYGPVREVAFGPGGGVLLGRNTADPARWKRYRGGTAGNLWIDAKGSGTFRRLITLEGNLASPMWIGSRVYFLSDHEGVGNLYSCRPDGRDLRRHTDHSEFYARFAVTDGTRIVYQSAAELYLFDPATDDGQVIDVDFRSPRVQRNRRFAKADRYLSGYSVHPRGHSIAVQTRGKLFSFALWEEAVRQPGRLDGVRYRLARWNGDGDQLVAISDEAGEDAVEIYDATGVASTRRLDGLDLGLVVDLAHSPTAPLLAVANQRHQLLLVDLGDGSVRELDRSPAGGLDGVTWSPDGRWLAYSFAATAQTLSIKVCEASTGETHFVTRPEFRDVNPSWDPKGEHLYFLSYRVFDPVYDALFFDLGFPRAVKPYAVTLRADLRSPFLPRPRPLSEDKASADEATSPKTAPPSPPPPPQVAIDFDNIANRIVAFPVPEGRYQKVVGIPGKVLLLTFPIEGSLDRDWSQLDQTPGGSLESFDFNDQKHQKLAGEVTGFEVSKDGTTVVYAAGRRLRAIKAGEKPPEGTDKEEPGRKSGWIDLDRVRVSVDPGAEWRQMLGEAWRLQRENFWVEDMSGIDWTAVRDRYMPLVDKVATRIEFSDLMWEMQGELGTSHAYEFGGDLRPAPAYAMGHLGADLRLERNRWRIEHIAEGDGWEPDRDSPLRAPGVNVAPGDTLLAVNGRPVDGDTPPARLLVNQAGVPVELTFGDSRGRKPRTVLVKTLKDERPARYREWVSSNRRFVSEATEGRVGYVHVPDMGPEGYAEFHRSYLSEVDRDALVVDVRFNGGGHVSQLVLEKLARRPLGYSVPRWGAPGTYPSDAPIGPLVVVTNELAGSDGDIFTHAFKLLKLGPVVGKRTWGGVIGIWPRHMLVDGSLTTQPEFSYWFTDVGWGVENYGTDPDYDVDIKPQDYAAGRDPQLDKAIQLVRQALRKHRPLLPDVTPTGRPNLALKPLPPRG